MFPSRAWWSTLCFIIDYVAATSLLKSQLAGVGTPDVKPAQKVLSRHRDYALMLIAVNHRRASTESRLRHFSVAQEIFAEDLQAARQLMKIYPDDADVERSLAGVLQGQAMAFAAADQRGLAQPMLVEAEQIYVSLRSKDPSNVEYGDMLSTCWREQAENLWMQDLSKAGMMKRS
jgi:hypothetical protein